ncbi:MAG TPA: hypothetical protein VNT79_07275 [Phycisphaerae bacterium]|nr:hypothetical protein [Phycisphaerae bacterium]
MVRRVEISTDVPADREMTITLPENVPVGPANIILLVDSTQENGTRTLGNLAESEFFGMWKDRENIGDSAAFAEKLRREAWSRGQ